MLMRFDFFRVDQIMITHTHTDIYRYRDVDKVDINRYNFSQG